MLKTQRTEFCPEHLPCGACQIGMGCKGSCLQQDLALEFYRAVWLGSVDLKVCLEGHLEPFLLWKVPQGENAAITITVHTLEIHDK